MTRRRQIHPPEAGPQGLRLKGYDYAKIGPTIGNKSKKLKFRDWGGAGWRGQNRNQREISWINVSTIIFPRFFFFSRKKYILN